MLPVLTLGRQESLAEKRFLITSGSSHSCWQDGLFRYLSLWAFLCKVARFTCAQVEPAVHVANLPLPGPVSCEFLLQFRPNSQPLRLDSPVLYIEDQHVLHSGLV